VVRNHVPKEVKGKASWHAWWWWEIKSLTVKGICRKETKSEKVKWDTHRMRPKNTTSSRGDEN